MGDVVVITSFEGQGVVEEASDSDKSSDTDSGSDSD